MNSGVVYLLAKSLGCSRRDWNLRHGMHDLRFLDLI